MPFPKNSGSEGAPKIEPARNCRIGLRRVGGIVSNCSRGGPGILRENLRILRIIVAAPRAMRLIKEMALALGIAIGAEGLAKMTEIGLTLLGGQSWPIH
jgi:hypothetical protein